MVRIKLGLLYGGKSAEHQVSLQTALAVINALNGEKFEVHPVYITENGEWIRGEIIEGKVQGVEELTLTEKATAKAISPTSLSTLSQEGEAVDVVFPLLHGPNGEDGTVQGMLELLNIPYVGNGVLGSAAGMDKVIMKNLFAQAGLKQVKYVHFLKVDWKNNEDAAYREVEQELGYPCFVKPANLGSSVGINKCTNREELVNAFEEAFQFDRKIIVEEGITAREVEIGVLGNDAPSCSVVGEIVAKTDFYDYKSKYQDGDTALIIPAEISKETYVRMEEEAIKAFKAIDGSGLVRADFFLTEDGSLVINEVNTMPGFTPFSMFPLLWEHKGVPYSELIEKLVELGMERHAEKQQIKHTM
ncbi:D-alanine--D-alanine ligase [Bacillus sp. JZ8]